MPLTVKQVLNAPTKEKNLRFLIDTLENLGFVTTSWHEGSVQRNVLEACAGGITNVSTLISNLVTNLYVEPKGEWLDFMGVFRFGIARLEAVKTIRDVTFTSAGSAPNHNITPNTVVAVNGIRYLTTNTSNVFLGTGLTVDIEVEAEFGGLAGNVIASAALTLQTVYTGVTVAFNGDPTTPGTDLEKDSRYWARCQLRWAALTYSSGLRAYEYWALTASASTTRVKALNNYPTENLVRVVLYPGTAAEQALVDAYVVDKHPPNDEVTTSAATVYSQAIDYAPTVPTGTSDNELNTAIQDNLDAMPIGGIIPAGSVVGKLLPDTIIEAIMCKKGARSVGLVTPASAVILGSTDIVQATFTVAPEYY